MYSVSKQSFLFETMKNVQDIQDKLKIKLFSQSVCKNIVMTYKLDLSFRVVPLCLKLYVSLCIYFLKHVDLWIDKRPVANISCMFRTIATCNVCLDNELTFFR